MNGCDVVPTNCPSPRESNWNERRKLWAGISGNIRKLSSNLVSTVHAQLKAQLNTTAVN